MKRVKLLAVLLVAGRTESTRNGMHEEHLGDLLQCDLTSKSDRPPIQKQTFIIPVTVTPMHSIGSEMATRDIIFTKYLPSVVKKGSNVKLGLIMGVSEPYVDRDHWTSRPFAVTVICMFSNAIGQGETLRIETVNVTSLASTELTSTIVTFN